MAKGSKRKPPPKPAGRQMSPRQEEMMDKKKHMMPDMHNEMHGSKGSKK